MMLLPSQQNAPDIEMESQFEPGQQMPAPSSQGKLLETIENQNEMIRMFEQIMELLEDKLDKENKVAQTGNGQGAKPDKPQKCRLEYRHP